MPGQRVAPHDYTVAQAVNDWLTHGLSGRDASTVGKLRILADKHVIPAVGARTLRRLSAEDVDARLTDKANVLSTRTLRDLHSILRWSVRRAQAREKVRRNVVLLCDCPVGRTGRPSKSLTLEQAEKLLAAAEADNSTMGAYVVVSLLSGCRTEEVRPLLWSHVVLLTETEIAALGEDKPRGHIKVWRSVRAGGDTKTKKSRRSLGIPQRCIDALRAQRERQLAARVAAGGDWQENGLVFGSEVGTELDAANVRRGFRRIATRAGLVAANWTPRELRHSFVSLLSDGGLSIEQISRLVGHSSTAVTETVYRHQLKPVVEDGATAMDRILPTTAA
jgi:integrase